MLAGVPVLSNGMKIPFRKNEKYKKEKL